MSTTMRSWVTDGGGGVRLEHRKVAVPEADEVLVEVLACGVCRTDLHVVDGELPPRREQVIPGHQVVGRVVWTGSRVEGLHLGDLVGAAWLRRTCGTCAWCRTARENLCPESVYTGWDADGGFAELTTVPAAYAYRLPSDADPVRTAPLLCAGIIGYRALQRAQLPPGGTLGLYGFGSSAHITAALAQAGGARVLAMTRGEHNRELARSLGVAWVGHTYDDLPEPLDSAIVFAPAGEIVPYALRAVAPGGTVVVAGIHLSAVPSLDYESTLFHEKDLRSVTANTRADGEAFLRLARHLDLGPQATPYAFDRLDEALQDLRGGKVSGSLVLTGA